jgi:hypothetical protein
MCDCPQRRNDVHWIEVDGDVVVVDPVDRSIHVLRGAAAAVWQLIDGEPIDGFVELISETFQQDPVRAADDLAASLQMLDEIGVLACAEMSILASPSDQ